MLLVAALGYNLVACGAAETSGGAAETGPSAGEKLNVVATTTLVGDVVRSIGGEQIDLTVMLAPGINPHTYEPAPQDVKSVADADVLFANGVGYEGFMSALIENAGGEATVIEVSDGIMLLEFAGEHEDEHVEGGEEAEHAEDEHAEAFDPHVWFNPQNVKIWANNIERALSERDAANAASYKANADTYRTRLDELDTWAKGEVETIPAENRKLVTDHDTFGYLAAHYGFDLIGAVLPSVSSDAEPSAQQLADVIALIRENSVPAVFVSNEVNATLARQVGEDTGAKLIPVYVESLTTGGREADTYEAFMRYNIGRIVEGLK